MKQLRESYFSIFLATPCFVTCYFKLSVRGPTLLPGFCYLYLRKSGCHHTYYCCHIDQFANIFLFSSWFVVHLNFCSDGIFFNSCDRRYEQECLISQNFSRSAMKLLFLIRLQKPFWLLDCGLLELFHIQKRLIPAVRVSDNPPSKCVLELWFVFLQFDLTYT